MLGEGFQGYLMVRVDCDTISAGFRGDQLLLLLYPAVHIGVGEFGPPPSEGLRRPLGRPRASWAVRAVSVATWLMHSGCSIPRRSVSVLRATLSRQRARAKARFRERLG